MIVILEIMIVITFGGGKKWSQGSFQNAGNVMFS